MLTAIPLTIIPLILYNVPARTACDLLPETVERLSGHPQIIGIKEATGNLARGREILERCGDDFLLLSGDDASCRELIGAGAQGVVTVTGNVAASDRNAMSSSASGASSRAIAAGPPVQPTSCVARTG